MLSAGQNADEYNKAYATLDSLRSDIIAGKTTFEDVASIYSVDAVRKCAEDLWVL